MSFQTTQVSKFLSLILRHQPEAIGLTLDNQGWAKIDELLKKAAAYGTPLTNELLREVVTTNNKQRFSFSEDGLKIRANQGHSIEVDLGLIAQPPPKTLYHGTASRFLDSIFKMGLVPKSRQYVHLSKDIKTAKKVGMRHGKIVVLEVDTQSMFQQGFKFYLSENQVWLTKQVPVEFIKETTLC